MKTNPIIFIADDDAEDVAFLESTLKERNAMVSCTTFANGLVLLNYLIHNTEVYPDIIVLDINMPVKNGFLTLHELKQNPLLKSIPVVMLTASSRLEDEERCNQMGCYAFLKKPTSVTGYTELAERILLFVQSHN